MSHNTVPTRRAMLIPLLNAIEDLGGKCVVDDVIPSIIKKMHLPNSVLTIMHIRHKEGELRWRLRWDLTYLKVIGCLSQLGNRKPYIITAKGLTYGHDRAIRGDDIEKEYFETIKERQA